MKTILFLAAISLCLAGSGVQTASAQVKKEKKKIETISAAKGAWLGVALKSVTKELKGEEDLKTSTGAYIDDVIDDSPAAEAGFQEGDVVIEFDGKKISDAEDLQKAVKDAGVGKKVNVVVFRDDEKKTLSATLTEQKKDAFALADAYREKSRRYSITLPPGAPTPPMPPRAMHFRSSASSGVYGMKLLELNEQLGAYFGTTDGKGVLVTEVKKESAAEKAGFKAGDVVLRAGKKTIEDAGDFRSVFGAFDKGESIPCEVIRKGEKLTLNLEAAGEEEKDNMFFFHSPGSGIMQWNGEGDDDEAFDISIPDVNIDIQRIGEGADLKELQESLKDLDVRVEEESDGPGVVRKRVTVTPKSGEGGGEKRIIIRTEKKDGKDI
ncbi:MAG: PDZ domain-containing protein [Ignavibacteriae bacterium]|nr:PDZ domain-containing protein [Ignavibacteriota bacterium]